MNRIINEDCLIGLDLIKSNTFDCCITSPPYFGLRDYGHADQIGLEKTPEEYVSKLVEVFSEVKRVLKPEGTLWLNIGDSYNTYTNNRGRTGLEKDTPIPAGRPGLTVPKNLKYKDLIGVPWMLAFALRADGWYLRQDIIWHKPNPMPESVTDRCTKAHEYIFLLSKSQKYYFDANIIKTLSVRNGDTQTFGGHKARKGQLEKTEPRNGHRSQENSQWGKDYETKLFANKRSVWSVSTKPYKEAHFATFPTELITDCMKAGCPPGGLVLDPFMGAGTTAIVAIDQAKNYLGFELNEEYCRIANARIKKFVIDNI